MKERRCGKCAWWEDIDDLPNTEGQRIEDGFNRQGECHHECAAIFKGAFDWCRHWSETTGWDRFEEIPSQLEHRAFEIFQKFWGASGNGPTPLDVRQWLEDYTKQC